MKIPSLRISTTVALATPIFLKTRMVWTCIRLIIVIGAVMAIVAFPTPHLRAGQPENQRVRAPELEGGRVAGAGGSFQLLSGEKSGRMWRGGRSYDQR